MVICSAAKVVECPTTRHGLASDTVMLGIRKVDKNYAWAEAQQLLPCRCTIIGPPTSAVSMIMRSFVECLHFALVLPCSHNRAPRAAACSSGCLRVAETPAIVELQVTNSVADALHLRKRPDLTVRCCPWCVSSQS